MDESESSTSAKSATRQLARLVEPIHAVTYYSPEILRFSEFGFKGWWHAYFAYRPSPMGAVGAGTVTSAFYNFAPRMVARAVPGVWEIMAPEAVAERRLNLVDEALRRTFGDQIDSDEMRDVARRGRMAIEGCDTAGRPVFGAYSDVVWPTEPHLSLWHACTLFRELRGDSHNLALASAGVNGVQSHLLMVANGHGNMASILGIRGWTEEQWQQANAELVARGWLTDDGRLTEKGRARRHAIEAHTDELSAEPERRIGEAAAIELGRGLTPFVDHLIGSGEVSATWPPPSVMK